MHRPPLRGDSETNGVDVGTTSKKFPNLYVNAVNKRIDDFEVRATIEAAQPIGAKTTWVAIPISQKSAYAMLPLYP